MSKQHIFTAVIEAADQGGAFVTIPFDVETAFGKKRVPVQATFDGAPYRGTLVRMGGLDHILIVRKDIREQIGKSSGDTITVTLEEDSAPRVVTAPDDFQGAMQVYPDVADFFQTLSYTHQKEYVNWIEEAKHDTTRQRRIAKAIERMRSGQQQR